VPTAKNEERRQLDRILQIKAETLTCRHFNGIQHDCCAAGVNYRALAGEPMVGCATRIPCLPIKEPKGGPMADCDKHSTWTQSEAEQRVADGEAAMERSMLAFRAAHDDTKAKRLGKGKGGQDSIPCPICERGRLYYRVAGYNGHMHAKCETEGCVSWME
jgi:hypothetical protein